MCPLGGLYIQVLLYINYYGVSLGWSLYTGSTVHRLLQCVPWVVFIYRFHCTSTTTMCPLGGFIYRFHCTSTTTVCPLGGLYIQVPLYIDYYGVSLGWSLYTGSTVHRLLQCVPWVVLYTGSTVHQLLRCVPWVVFIYRFHCTSTTTVCPLGGLYIQVPLYINDYSMSLGWSLYTGSTVPLSSFHVNPYNITSEQGGAYLPTLPYHRKELRSFFKLDKLVYGSKPALGELAPCY